MCFNFGSKEKREIQKKESMRGLQHIGVPYYGTPHPYCPPPAEKMTKGDTALINPLPTTTLTPDHHDQFGSTCVDSYKPAPYPQTTTPTDASVGNKREEESNDEAPKEKASAMGYLDHKGVSQKQYLEDN